MAICILLIIMWVLYTVALGKFFFYICDLPPAPIFEINSLGLCSGFVLAMFGWIAYTILAAEYIFGG